MTSVRPLTTGIQQLLAHPLFEGVQKEVVAPLLDRVLVRTVPKGSLLHSPGEPSSPMYLVLQGRLGAYQVTPDGRKLLLEIIPAGGFDGFLPMLGKRGHFTQAAEKSVAASLDWALLEQLFAVEPRIVRSLTELVARRLESREEQLESMMLRDPTRRLARQLAALARVIGQSQADGRLILPVGITHQVLADMLGIRRETVTIHLHDLVNFGALEVQHRRLIIDRERLEAIAAQPADGGSPAGAQGFLTGGS
jgi:CRP-like cAMP-binding protein